MSFLFIRGYSVAKTGQAGSGLLNMRALNPSSAEAAIVQAQVCGVHIEYYLAQDNGHRPGVRRALCCASLRDSSTCVQILSY